MTEIPKIVYERLRAALPQAGSLGAAHPDANVLTAFAEQALSAVESDGVLNHLALCQDCREILILALPAADEAVSARIAAHTESDRAARILTKKKDERSWLTMLTRPSMRWAALAAGVVVAASVLLVHPGKLNQPILPSVNQQAAGTTAVPAPSSPVASLSADQGVSRTEVVDNPRPSSGLLLSKKQSPNKAKTERDLPSFYQAKSGMLPADNQGTPGLAERSPSASLVTGSTATVAEASAEGSPMARNDATAIERAKPAVQPTEANELQTGQVVTGLSSARADAPASPALARNISWTILAGTLRRSSDNGQNWQNALHADHPLLCYASYGQQVWAGGQAGTIFHSVNGGVTWVQVMPSVKDQILGSDISRIEILGDVKGTETIVVSTSNNERWTSVDSGNTWRKN
jgi:hypothetical protein